MAGIMVAFWGGVAWIIVSMVRHSGANTGSVRSVAANSVPSPEDILHERLARGEIDVEEYHQRLYAVRAKRRV